MKLLKLGGSLITNKSGWKEANPENINALAKAVASAWKKSPRDWIIVHGAGSFGHPLVVKYGINNGVKNTQQKLSFALTHNACMELSALVCSALNAVGIPAVSIPPAMIITSKNKRIHSFDMKIVEDYLESGFVPVLFGDMVPDLDLGGSVCSGDQIISYLGKSAEQIILATDVDGVLDDKNNVITEINEQNFTEISKHLKDSDRKDVTGAMAGKLNELLQLDTPSYIVNGLKPERIESLMLGKQTISTKVSKK
ncbi:MAG: isopentenyl phosphate kinase [Candidatus Micrarchaeota archaeon]